MHTYSIADQGYQMVDYAQFPFNALLQCQDIDVAQAWQLRTATPNNGYYPNWGAWAAMPADDAPLLNAGFNMILPFTLMTIHNGS